MLPDLSTNGDLPIGIHLADWREFEARFGRGSPARTHGFARWRHLHELATQTTRLLRFIVFGSFVSDVPTPRDVDVVLIMGADFKIEAAPRESRTLFAHADAEARFGASVFWVREGMLPPDLMGRLLETRQTKRDGSRRGIVEIKA